MNLYHIDFKVNGKLNPHGVEVFSTSLLSAVEISVSVLHSTYDDVVDSFEIISAFFVRGS